VVQLAAMETLYMVLPAFSPHLLLSLLSYFDILYSMILTPDFDTCCADIDSELSSAHIDQSVKWFVRNISTKLYVMYNLHTG